MAEGGKAHVGEEDRRRNTEGLVNGEVREGRTNGKILLSDDMLFKLSKKIAQLTKVIYSLNTKNDDLELDMEMMRASYEQKLQKDLAGEEGKKDSQELELKKELRKAKHQLKQYELKIKGIEEEHRNQLANVPTRGQGEGGQRTELEQLQRQVEKERVEHRRRMEALENQLDLSKSQNQVLTRDLEELSSEQETLKLQLSASKLKNELSSEAERTREEKREKEEKEREREEMLSNLLTLRADNDALRAELDMMLKSHQEQKDRNRRTLERMEEAKSLLQDQLISVKCEKAQFEQSLLDSRQYFETEIKTLVEEKQVFQDNYDEMKSHYEAEIRHFQTLANKREEELGVLKFEVMKIKESLIAQEPRHREALEELLERIRLGETEVRRMEGELALSQLTSQAAAVQVRALTEQLAAQQLTAHQTDKELTQSLERLGRVQREMGQANEKLAVLDEKFKVVEGERDGLRKKIKETDIKIEMLNKKQREDQTNDQRVRDLETALEGALIEREQILEACEKEIEQERNIAIELEQKMMDDFEWKLREVESGYRQKNKLLEESIESKLREQEREINRQKDAELTRMCIEARRDMEEKLKQEREALRSTLEAAARSERDTAVTQITLQKDREIRLLQRSWEEEKGRLEKETKRLQSQIEQEVARQVSRVRTECDQKVFEMGRKHALVIEKYQEEYDSTKEELEGKLNLLRAENTEKLEDYEQKISDLLSGKVHTILNMREDIESELSDRMTGLRDIYRTEIQQQQDLYTKDLDKWKEMERCLNLKIEEKRQELEDNITYYTQREVELEAKIDELMTRLQEQTAAYMKLQTEFDNYDWWEEDDEAAEEAGGHRKAGDGAGVPRSRPPTRPPTREGLDRVSTQEEAREVEKEELICSSSGSGPLEEESGRSVCSGISDEPGVEPGAPPRKNLLQEDQRRSYSDAESTTKRNSTSSGKSNKKSNCSQQ